MRDAVILGCGYVGRRVVDRLLAAGVRVHAVDRDAGALAGAAAAGASTIALDLAGGASLERLAALAEGLAPGYGVLCSLPAVDRRSERADPTPAALAALRGAGSAVYLSTTSVYGDAVVVDASTPADPRTPAARRWVETERAVLAGAGRATVLRASAIYGPGRGVHARGGAGRGDPDRVVSRIHVDDLAAVCVAALSRAVGGAWPVADEEPASAREVARACADLGLRLPALPAPASGVPTGRRVDGRAILSALGVTLAYPSFRDGVPASLRDSGRSHAPEVLGRSRAAR